MSEGQREHDVHEGAMRRAGQQRDWTSGTGQGGQAQALGPGQAVRGESWLSKGQRTQLWTHAWMRAGQMSGLAVV